MKAKRIVVIEDDPAILRGLTEQLRMEPYDVATAADGSDGFRLVWEQQPDLVILDLTLPRMSGHEICRQMRSHGLATPILMLTAHDGERNRVEGFEAGADDYVTKPFSMRELLGRVRAILRRSEGRADIANQRELDEARRLQQRLMASEIPQLPGVRIAAEWHPARIAGGDYFNVLKLNDEIVAICIGDVSGKGMPAAMVASSLHAVLKVYASLETRPRDVCAQINRVMCESLAGHGFVSFFFALIDCRRKELTYCNAGHNPPILVSGRSARLLDRGGVVFGVVEAWDYEEDRLSFHSGDRLLMYTDGITESHNPDGEEFGAARLTNLIMQLPQTDAASLMKETIETAAGFTNSKFEDDLTLIAVTID